MIDYAALIVAGLIVLGALSLAAALSTALQHTLSLFVAAVIVLAVAYLVARFCTWARTLLPEPRNPYIATGWPDREPGELPEVER